MTGLPSEIRQAIDLARNHHLIEEEEIYVTEDGRQFFERRLRDFLSVHSDAVTVIGNIPSFTTTCWKTAHPQAEGGKITWPWTIR